MNLKTRTKTAAESADSALPIPEVQPKTPPLPRHIQAYNLLREELAESGEYPVWDDLDAFTKQLFEKAASATSRIQARLSRYQEIVESL